MKSRTICFLLAVWLASSPAFAWSDRETAVTNLSYSPNGEMLAAAWTVFNHDLPDSDPHHLFEEVRIWNVDDSSVLALWEEPEAHCLDFSPDGTHLAIGTLGAGIVLWRLSDKSEIARIRIPKTAELSEAEEGEQPGPQASAGDEPILDIVFSDDGRYLGALANRTVVVWELSDLASPREIGRIPDMGLFAFGKDGNSLVCTTSNESKEATIFELSTLETRKEILADKLGLQWAMGVAMDRHGTRVVQSRNGVVELVNLNTNRASILMQTSDEIKGAWFDRSGERIAVATWNIDDETYSVRLLGVDPQKQFGDFAHPCSVMSVAIAPNGMYVAIGGNSMRPGERRDDFPVKIWEIESGRLVAELYYDQPPEESIFANATWLVCVIVVFVAIIALMAVFLLRRRARRQRGQS